MRTNYSRGVYQEFKKYPSFVSSVLKNLEKIGSFSTGIESLNRKGGFEAINVDVYGWDFSDKTIVFQVRRSYKSKSSRFLSVRKDYYLAGRNENGSVFSHSIPSPLRSALGKPSDAVRFAKKKIFDCSEKELKSLVRQGDVAFIPVKTIPKDAEKIELNKFLVDNHSHLLEGEAFIKNNKVFVHGKASLKHLKNQHKEVHVEGTYRVQVGYREPVWGYSSPTRD